MSNSFSGGSATISSNPGATLAAGNFAKYLDGLDTSVVDNTNKNLANNAYGLSSQLPNYVYNANGSDEARQRMENAVYNQATSKLNKQFGTDMSDLQTKLQNQGLGVGGQAYQNAVSSLQDSHYDNLNNAAYNSIIQGQNAFSNSLDDTIKSGNFTNNSRQMTLNEILQSLQNNVSTYQMQKDKYNAFSGASGSVTEQGKNGVNMQQLMQLGMMVGQLSDARSKENIKAVGRLDNGLTVYCFNYIGSPMPQIGLIAQEVMQVNPEAVMEGKDGLLRVNYALACK